MSDTSVVDNATDTVATSTPVAPAANGSTSEAPGSTPASVDATASTAKPEGEEPKQSRSESRRQANQRREIRELHREIGYMRAQLEGKAPPAQTDPAEHGGQERPSPADVATQRRQAAKAQLALDRLEDAGDSIEGFDAVLQKITAKDFPITEAIVDFLAESDKAAQVAAWMAEHPEETYRISMMSEWRADRALEKVAASLTSKPAPRTTNTPPPPPTLTPRGAPQVSLESASMEDFVRIRNEQRAKAGFR